MAEAAKGNFEPRRKVLRTVYFSGYLIWGKPVIGTLERMVMESSRLEYNGKMVNGFPPAQRQDRGSVARMIKRMVQTIFGEPLRYAHDKWIFFGLATF